MQNDLLQEIHNSMSIPSQETDCIYHVVKGRYNYYHYKCDRFNDVVSVS